MWRQQLCKLEVPGGIIGLQKQNLENGSFIDSFRNKKDPVEKRMLSKVNNNSTRNYA